MWLPDGSIYFAKDDSPHVRPDRPLSIGDVFTDVPVPLIPKHKATVDEDTLHKSKQVTVMLLGHPCSIYAGGRVAVSQLVAQVRTKDEATSGRPFEPPWDGHWFCFPLPNFANDQDYVVDFRRIGTTHYKYLQEKRVACLTKEGWAAVFKRFTYHSTRLELQLDRVVEAVTVYWTEFELWEKWNARGLPSEQFQRWLHEGLGGDSRYSGTERMAVLEFAPDLVEDDFPGPEDATNGSADQP